ncbi:MAG TPA: hypothetical protein VI451_18870, partial [Anaerolineales bacterium]|nr:hypothetical protein [Anaerolineales bacterium]
ETARLLPELVSFAPGQTFTLRGREPRPGLPGLPGPAAESRLWEGITQPVVLDGVLVGNEIGIYLEMEAIKQAVAVPA